MTPEEQAMNRQAIVNTMMQQPGQPVPPPSLFTGGPDNTQDYGYGKREDGTNKGLGYFGMIPRTDDPSLKSSELSYSYNINGKDILMPAIVPTLTREELNLLLSGQPPNKAMEDKMVDHAMQRIRAGKNTFAQPGEQIAPPQ